MAAKTVSHPITPPPSPPPVLELKKLVVDLSGAGACETVTTELGSSSSRSSSSDPDDGCDKYSCRSGESEVTATVNDDVPAAPTDNLHNTQSHSKSDHIVPQPTGPSEASATTTCTAVPPLKQNLLNTYLRRLFDHYKVTIFLLFDLASS